ncbi:MAG: NAD(P)/FAD-dependent oxidoreductase [Candidatus Thermoplasmatota archaeon]
MNHEIIIIGAGPAGAYLGYLLASQGYTPLLFDHTHPREKPCGGGLTALAVRKFPILQKTPNKKLLDDPITLIAPDGTAVSTYGKKDCILISRLDLDTMLVTEAQKNGCILIKERVENITYANKTWTLHTPQKTYTSTLIVGADGVQSILRKKTTGPIPHQHLGVCYGCFATTTTPQPGSIRFFPGIKGYAWCFPAKDRYNLGIGVPYSHASHLKTLFHQFLTTHYPAMNLQKTWGAYIPSASSSDFFTTPCAGKNWMLLGDAAGHVDPIMGEGITYALWSAEQASIAIQNNDILSYDRLWRNAYGKRLVTSCQLRNYFYHPWFLNNLIHLAATSETLTDLIYKKMMNWYSFEEFFIRLLLKTPRITRQYFSMHTK